MSQHMPDWFFHMMAFGFKLRDYFRPRKHVIEDIGIKPGDSVVDFGCGPGGYVLPIANLIGKTGKLYALDIHPLSIKYVQNLVKKRGLTNVSIILSGCGTGLPDSSIDVVLLYDILHGLGEVKPGLKEVQYMTGQRLTDSSDNSQLMTILIDLHRVLKPQGILSVNDHHLSQAEIIGTVTASGLYKQAFNGKKTINFKRGGLQAE